MEEFVDIVALFGGRLYEVHVIYSGKFFSYGSWDFSIFAVDFITLRIFIYN